MKHGLHVRPELRRKPQSCKERREAAAERKARRERERCPKCGHRVPR